MDRKRKRKGGDILKEDRESRLTEVYCRYTHPSCLVCSYLSQQFSEFQKVYLFTM
jgi:hypothetical protein